jgi:hypothetical protein
MAKRTGFFKRIGTPTVLMIGNTPKIVKTNDVIHADFDFMMTQSGWKFEPKFDPTKANTAPAAAKPRATIQQLHDTYKAINAKSIPVLLTPPSKTVTNTVITESNTSTASADIVINIDKLKGLKVLTNKDWMKLSKDDCLAILQEARADYSHVEQSKWELVKFIKKLIQDL